MEPDPDALARRSKLLGVLAGAVVAAAGIAIGLAGGLLGQRRMRPRR
jgi:hypothetical protein